jgi:hypothetical protein
VVGRGADARLGRALRCVPFGARVFRGAALARFALCLRAVLRSTTSAPLAPGRRSFGSSMEDATQTVGVRAAVL